MVRFIMLYPKGNEKHNNHIYIPIWLDLLSCFDSHEYFRHINLHSNMVRFIIPSKMLTVMNHHHLHSNMVRFIMHFGVAPHDETLGIYIPIWLDLLFDNNRITQYFRKYLHSNMVRFIIDLNWNYRLSHLRFTFQYG